MIVLITQKTFDEENEVWHVVATVDTGNGTTTGPYDIVGTAGTRESTLIKHIKDAWGIVDNDE